MKRRGVRAKACRGCGVMYVVERYTRGGKGGINGKCDRCRAAVALAGYHRRKDLEERRRRERERYRTDPAWRQKRRDQVVVYGQRMRDAVLEEQA